MIATHPIIRVALVLGSLLLTGSAWADDRERQVAIEINKANEVLRGGDIDGAVKAYQKVQEGTSERADLSYNMAIAQYRKGDIAAAQKLFKETATAEDDAVAAKSRYNLGNCNYAAALKQAESDRPAAIKGLNDAIADYRSALEVDPNDADSRANIELASAMIEKLREQEKKDQQQKDQQQKDQQQKDQQQKDQQQKDQQQKDQQQKDQQQKDQQQQDQQQGGGNKDEQKESKPESAENKQQAEQPKDQQKPQDQKDQKQSQDNESKDQKDSQDKQQKSGDDQKEQKSQQSEDSKSEGKDSKEQSDKQQKPSPDQKQPSQSTTQKNSKDKQPEQKSVQPAGEPKEQDGKAAPKGSLTTADKKADQDEQKEKALAAKEMAPDGTMTVQEAEKMLQSIRDQEMIRRLRRQAAERNRHIPVDRDW